MTVLIFERVAHLVERVFVLNAKVLPFTKNTVGSLCGTRQTCAL